MDFGFLFYIGQLVVFSLVMARQQLLTANTLLSLTNVTLLSIIIKAKVNTDRCDKQKVYLTVRKIMSCYIRKTVNYQNYFVEPVRQTSTRT